LVYAETSFPSRGWLTVLHSSSRATNAPGGHGVPVATTGSWRRSRSTRARCGSRCPAPCCRASPCRQG